MDGPDLCNECRSHTTVTMVVNTSRMSIGVPCQCTRCGKPATRVVLPPDPRDARIRELEAERDRLAHYRDIYVMSERLRKDAVLRLEECARQHQAAVDECDALREALRWLHGAARAYREAERATYDAYEAWNALTDRNHTDEEYTAVRDQCVIADRHEAEARDAIDAALAEAEKHMGGDG